MRGRQEKRRGEERKVREGERHKRMRVAERAREEEREIKGGEGEIEMKWEREADVVRERGAERENISQRASRCECVGSEQQHIRLHRGPQREASWLSMPSAKTDI